jgi:transcriptional regulator with XRE-family HTH domain
MMATMSAMTKQADSHKLRTVFASNLRKRRESLGLSQESLADAAGLHRTYVGSVERGERNISIDNIQRLAEAVGSSGASLLQEATL